MKSKLKWITAGMTAAMLCGSMNIAMAKPVTGMAYIENGNVRVAKEKAKKDAMRNFVEQEVGVNVKSQSEMANFMLIKDIVTTNSNGFVVVKKTISEKAEGSIFTIVLDLEHGPKPLELAPDDIAAQLENLAENSSRNGLDVAIIDSTAKDTMAYNMFMMNRLNSAGFRVNVNDAALEYLKNNFQKDDLSINVGIRQAAKKDRFDSMALVRGRVSIARQPEQVKSRTYRAVAEIACQIISYDDNTADSVSLYADDIGRTPEEAVKKAKDKAISDAVMELARSASKTIQRESRGVNGMGMVLKSVLIFDGIYDRANEPALINRALENVGCRIVRKGFTPQGAYQVFVTYQAVGDENVNTLANMVRDRLQASYGGIAYPEESKGAGSTKYIIRLRG